MRDIKLENIEKRNPDKTKLLCKPGAKIENVIKEIKFQESKYEIKKLIVHVGGNNLREDEATTIFNKLKDMLIEIKNLLPNTKIYYSLILPRIDSSFLSGIDWINTNITLFCKANNIVTIKHDSFEKNGNINKILISRDMIHPTEKGTITFARDIIYEYRQYGNNR